MKSLIKRCQLDDDGSCRLEHQISRDGQNILDDLERREVFEGLDDLSLDLIDDCLHVCGFFGNDSSQVFNHLLQRAPLSRCVRCVRTVTDSTTKTIFGVIDGPVALRAIESWLDFLTSRDVFPLLYPDGFARISHTSPGVNLVFEVNEDSLNGVLDSVNGVDTGPCTALQFVSDDTMGSKYIHPN